MHYYITCNNINTSAAMAITPNKPTITNLFPASADQKLPDAFAGALAFFLATKITSFV